MTKSSYLVVVDVILVEVDTVDVDVDIGAVDVEVDGLQTKRLQNFNWEQKYNVDNSKNSVGWFKIS